MAVIAAHPSAEELADFTLGALAADVDATIEAHLAACPLCQERAAAVPDDGLVALLRSADGRAGRPGDTDVEAVTLAPPAADVCAAADALPPELARHERYRVLRRLGAGGMGVVYAAEHRVMQRTVALKVINRSRVAGAGAAERFRLETRAAARLSHPNIVSTYDAEDAGPYHFLVMECVEGECLSRLVTERGPLPVAEACSAVRQAALGLAHAHERGMVHRDVKPGNLIRCADGTVKLLDFGLAALTAEPRGAPAADNVIMGTPEYMAPEQAADPRRADIRADVYSLGCTLYHLLTGAVPYPAPTVVQKLLAHCGRPVPDLRAACPEAPPALAAVLVRLLAKKPADRYQTPLAVAEALAPFAAAPARPVRRRRALPIVLALTVLALAAGIIYRVQTDRGDLVITTESDDVEVVIKEAGRVVRVIDVKTAQQIALSLRSGAYELELKGAPDGLRLSLDRATLTRGATVLARIERVARGAATTDADVPVLQPLYRFPFAEGDRFFSIDISPDGRYVLAGRGKAARLRVWDLQTGVLYREWTGTIGRFTPDSRHVIATAWIDFDVYDLPTGQRVRHFAAPQQCYDFFLAAEGTRLLDVTPTRHEIYDWATGKELCRIPWRANSRAFLTRDGRHLLQQPTGGPPLRVFDTATGQEVAALRQLGDVPLVESLSADANRVICLAGRGRQAFDVATGKQLAELPALDGEGLSGDGRLFVTSTNQRDEYGVWDVERGQLVARLRFPEFLTFPHPNPRISRDGRFVVFGGPGEAVYVFRLPEATAAATRP